MPSASHSYWGGDKTFGLWMEKTSGCALLHLRLLEVVGLFPLSKPCGREVTLPGLATDACLVKA